jgi:hypothetical protein
MKFNWGTGIFAFIVVFLLALATFIYWTTTLDYDLVEKDYYPKELDYNTQIEKESNTAGLAEKIGITLTDSVLIVQFPSFACSGKPEGEILIYRPSDGSLDRRYDISPGDSCRQPIPAATLVRGKYVVKIDWRYGGKNYYQEQLIMKE